MPADSTTALRPSQRLRADLPEPANDWPSRSTRPVVLALAVVFVLIGGSGLELGPVEARVGMASGEAIGPFGRVFGYWDPSLWPLPVALGRICVAFEEIGPTQNSVRWPSAIAGVLIGFILTRRARMAIGPRAGVLVALAWYGSVGLMDRSAGTGLDLIAGLGTVAALDRLLAKGSGRVVGAWASLAFLAAGWPPLVVLALATVVLGRSGATWSWTMTWPIAATIAGWSGWALAVAPAEAWASALALPIMQSSAWGLGLTLFGLGLPWGPFAALAVSRRVREGWSSQGREVTLGWLKVIGASLIVGMIVPGLASAALVPALAGLAIVSATCWDRLLGDSDATPLPSGRKAAWAVLAIASFWLILSLGWGGYVGFAVAYYRSTTIIVGIISFLGFLMAIRSVRLRQVRWGLGAMVAVSVALKLAHWGYYVPESNYRTGAGAWGRAIGQWVPEKHPIYVLHSWPADLCFSTGRMVRQLPTPLHIDFQPGEGSKFVLLQDSEYAEYQVWQKGWPKLIKVAEFEDEMGLGKRILTRTDAPLIVERPFRRHDPVD